MTDTTGGSPTVSVTPTTSTTTNTSTTPAVKSTTQAPTGGKAPVVEASSEPISIGADGLVPLKINGVEKRVTLQEAVQLAQKGEAADQRFKSAAEIERKTKQQTQAMSEFLNELKTNPRKVLSDPKLGLDLRNFAESYLGEQIQEEMRLSSMTPEQKEIMDYKKKLAAYEEQEKKHNDTKKEELRKQESEKMINQITGEINEALSKAKIFRDQKYAVGRMAYYMDYASKNKIPLTWDQAALQVKKDTSEGLRDYAKAYESDDELAESLGDDLIKRLNQYMINKTKNKSFGGTKPTVNPNQQTSTHKKSKKMNSDQFREMLNEKHGTNL